MELSKVNVDVRSAAKKGAARRVRSGGSVPGVLYGDRVHEVDMRFGKILRFGKTRANVGVDIYNLLNSQAILSYNQTFIPNGAWLIPARQVVEIGLLVESAAQIVGIAFASAEQDDHSVGERLPQFGAARCVDGGRRLGAPSGGQQSQESSNQAMREHP